ncbi:amidase [Microbacterium suaedae]|uniref:amidase n=1 Tax=Microbacterium suaedae TaxID=2067813 RepID=UPI000DA1BDDA|nr:amidase [Microbacterium suaedae]
MEFFEQSLVGLATALRGGEVSPVDVARHFLERIDAAGELGAFVEVISERALAQAADLGDPPVDAPPLWGVPLADKDLVARAGVPTRYGSRAFAENLSADSDPLALALDRLGSVSLGKTNTPEFGLTGYTESAIAPPARNPWNTDTGAGGSSGGAATAVAAGLLPAAPASDGGGSIRIPAATVGVVGLKPSRGRLPFANGLESPGGLSTAGPIARSVADVGYLLDALAGSAPHSYATRAPDPEGGGASAALRRDPGRLRIGATLVTPWDGWTDTSLDPRARAAYDGAAAILVSAGHAVDEADWRPEGYPEMFATLWRASAARIPVPDADLDALTEPLTAWLVREGRAMSAERVIGGYQAAAAFERRTIEAFAPFDAVLTPALAMEPQKVGWFSSVDPEENFARQCSYAPHTSFVNVSGLPAITVPVTSEEGERPWSVQLVGRPGGEAAILQLAAQLEAARGPLPWPTLTY